MKRLIYSLAIVAAGALTLAGSAQAAQSDPQTQEAKEFKKGYRSAKFSVNLRCENCVNKVSENISFEKGVKGMDISLDNKTVNVIYDPTKTDEETIGQAIRKLGYDVSLIEPEQKPDQKPEQKPEQK